MGFKIHSKQHCKVFSANSKGSVSEFQFFGTGIWGKMLRNKLMWGVYSEKAIVKAGGKW